MQPLSQRVPTEMRELRSVGKTCAVIALLGRGIEGTGRSVVCVDWIVELSGSWTVIAGVFPGNFVEVLDAERKCPVAPVSRINGGWARFIVVAGLITSLELATEL